MKVYGNGHGAMIRPGQERLPDVLIGRLGGNGVFGHYSAPWDHTWWWSFARTTGLQQVPLADNIFTFALTTASAPVMFRESNGCGRSAYRDPAMPKPGNGRNK